MLTQNIALLGLHVATGAFFTITGYRKVFMPAVRERVLPFIASHFRNRSYKLARLVTVGEFLGGLGLLTGTLTQAAAAGLFIIMIGAYLTDTVPNIWSKDKGEHWTKLCSNMLCTPEWQLLVILAAIILMGGGSFALDYFIF